MPPKTPYPTPALRLHNGAWKIIWNYGGKQFSVSTGHPEGDKVFAEKWRADFAIALKQDAPAFPDEFVDAAAVEKYIEVRYGTGARSRASTGDWLADYEIDIAGECSLKWAAYSIEVLKRSDQRLGGIAKATPDKISTYLAEIAKTKKPATRNRTLNILSRFYRWAARTRGAKTIPTEGIKRITEEKGADIIYCTAAEREEIISMARESKWIDWLAIPIAFYSGKRREEVSRLRWEDIRFTEGLIVVHKSKTAKSRVIPLASALEKILLDVPKDKRTGFVVTTPPDVNRMLRLDNLVRHLCRMKRDRVLKDWGLEKPPPSRAKDYKEKLDAWKVAMEKKEAELAATLGRIGWNSFRHTFGSLLAQAGVSIDKISAWMGNTPEVCRRHYAQFIPRDRRDNEIDKL